MNERKHIKTFESYVNEKTDYSIKPDLRKIKKWGQKPLKDAYGGSEYSDFAPKEWDVDMFKSFIEDKMIDDGYLNKNVASMFGFDADTNIIEYLNENGSGLNNNKNYKQLGSWRSALYDIWEYVKLELGW